MDWCANSWGMFCNQYRLVYCHLINLEKNAKNKLINNNFLPLLLNPLHFALLKLCFKCEKTFFISIIGDLMARWTSDRWVSTLHRVIALPGQPARKSLAFFHNPDWDAEIAPLDGSGSYETVLSGQYLMSKFKSTSKWKNQIKFYDLHNFPLVQSFLFGTYL